MLRTISASDKCVDFAVASVTDFQHFRAPANSSTAGGFFVYVRLVSEKLEFKLVLQVIIANYGYHINVHKLLY